MKPGKPGDREPIRRGDVGAGSATIKLDAVHMGRKGWRFEVSVEFDTHDEPKVLKDPEGLLVREPGGPVRRSDVVWLPNEGEATQLYRSAEATIARGVGSFESAGGMSGLARELGVTFALS